MATTLDVNILIAYAIDNNKQGVIDAMNSSGYPVSASITDPDLFNAVFNVFTTRGISALHAVMLKVPVIHSKTTVEEAEVIYNRFNAVPIDASVAKFNFSTFFQKFGDFFSGSTTITAEPTVVVQAPTIKAGTIIALAIGGIVAIIALIFLLRKS